MKLPFSQEQFLNVFNQYNNSVWPSQIAIYVVAVIIFFNLFRPRKNSSIVISSILGAYWLWMGIMYHLMFFMKINPAAKFFGFIFVLQGLFFLFEGVLRKNISFQYNNSLTHKLGVFFMVFGTVIYPILGFFVGHRYPASPTFGLPCPTTIFTFGVLLITSKFPKYLLAIPFIWSLIGFSAALTLGIYEDVSLLIAGISGLVFITLKKNSS